MRTTIDQALELVCPRIWEIRIDPRCQDALPGVLRGLEELYVN